jgi:tetratricopeptide (TPR) repeat protein
MRLVVFIKRVGVVAIFYLAVMHNTFAQRSVIEVFKSDRALADQYFARGEIKEAIELYERSSKKGESNLVLGRAYYLLKEYGKSIHAYEFHIKAGKKLETSDYLNYAEANLVLKKYDRAREAYQKILNLEPDNQWIVKKMWRISNIHYLYEDSIHFATRLLSINTSSAEWGSVPIKDKLLFLSNRTTGNPVKQVDATTHQSFYRMFGAKEKPDTLQDGWSKLYASPRSYDKAPAVKGNAAGFYIYDRDKKMVLSASSEQKGQFDKRTLGLYFAELKDGKWKIINAFDHNSTAWSVTNPSIDTVKNVLYFASDKPGGFGGMDLYQSHWINNRWTDPINLGDVINTPGDEIFPYAHQGMLYFSSNGQPGLGGLDIFKIDLLQILSDEPVNLGYPMNSSFDDFSITLTDTKGSHGFLSSNRKAGGLDDDIYEFDMDMQTYPFEITGIIKQMDHGWNKDSTQVLVLSNARILLMDNQRNVIVHETTSDSTGAFTLPIPYFSKYAIRVVDSDGAENTAVLEIPRQRKKSYVHEIMVVKDIFQSITK